MQAGQGKMKVQTAEINIIWQACASLGDKESYNPLRSMQNREIRWNTSPDTVANIPPRELFGFYLPTINFNFQREHIKFRIVTNSETGLSGKFKEDLR